MVILTRQQTKNFSTVTKTGCGEGGNKRTRFINHKVMKYISRLTLEAVLCDCLQQQEEVCSVFRKLLKVLIGERQKLCVKYTNMNSKHMQI